MFVNRQDAGEQLAKKVQEKGIESPLLLALPRGGVPIAYEISQQLNLPMDVLIARKLGAPINPEFAFGALAEGGGEYIEESVVQMLKLTQQQVNDVRQKEEERIAELQGLFRRGENLPSLENRNVIIIDDGVATGSTAVAAAMGAKKLGAKKVFVASPVVAARSLVHQRVDVIDEVIYVICPEEFMAVGQWYEDFDQVTTDEAIELLGNGHRERTSGKFESRERSIPLEGREL